MHRSPVSSGWEKGPQQQQQQQHQQQHQPPPLLPPPLQQMPQEDHRDWDFQSNRMQHNNPRDNPRGGNRHENPPGKREDHGKRYSGNRRFRGAGENEDRWRSESPSSVRNFRDNRRDFPRDLRQGSVEPLFNPHNNSNDMNRGRDSRSVEPQGFMDKYQGKPPSGRRMNDRKDGNMSKGWKLEQLPPRFQKKFLEQNGYPPNTPINAIDDSWDGNGLSFQVRLFN